MAPRSAKTKKVTDVKVAEEAPKGKGKGKLVEEPVIEAKDEVKENNDAVSVTDKKVKRGKKKVASNTNGQDHVDDKSEENAPPAKKGRKKKVAESDADEASTDGHDNGDAETNGDSEETEKVPTGRGRNKQAKKPVEPKEVKTGRGRKTQAEKANGDAEKESLEKKPSAAKRGRKAQSKDEENEEEDVKSEPVAKGRKRAPKVVKEKTPESEKEVDDKEELEEKVVEEPKKKEAKGRKGRGKKAKEEIEEDNEEEQTEEKGKGDAKADEEAEEVEEEAKPVKGKRAPKKRSADTKQEETDTGEPMKKKRALSQDVKTAPPKNKSSTDFDALDFSNSSKNQQEKEWNFKIASWNVDGIRAWLNKGGLDYIKYEKPDILCLQETKCAQDKLPDEVANLPGYHAYWLGSDKDGYAGVGIYTTKLAMNVQYGLQDEELDSEGRIITAEYEHFYLICTYVPNAGRNLVTLPKRLKWNEQFRKYVNDLNKKKPVIICGDMNVSHEEIDLANPKTNKKNAGFTIEERTGMSELLGDGFVDTFRHLYPDKTGAYTFWTYMKNSRSKNVGWRLDYFIVSERLLPSLCDNVIRDQVYGSDHCPITLFLHLTSADKPK
ncbi:DNA repair nuclease/redox regulator APEX1 isoform X2 [Plodia interpunctella]|uniref:DNA repair nuclease/redox regulator APEX1 isoform X2 n=1 Tax=Plodia interpunctella TaxID=58824 RepID=UPI002367AE8C|nr:DNA-(apurinic or apyrimidinic site) endonuclease isoform X2 [Plodia interpunctella]